MSLKALQEYTYWSKYARHNKAAKRRETWFEAVSRVEEMHLRKYPQIAKEIKWAFDQVRHKRVLGSQRALQFGGEPIERKNARLYNCLGVETEFITSHGVRSFSDFKDGDDVVVLTHTGAWKKAVARCYGKQKLHKIKIKRGEATHEVRATKNHRWFLANGEVTDNLQEEDTLMFAPNIFGEFDYHAAPPDERLYWAYGYVYGDGTMLKDRDGEYRYSMVRLCDDDSKYRERFEELGFSTSTSMSLDGDYIAFTGKYLKTLPDPKVDDPRLVRAFVRGYMDADGITNRSRGGKYGSPSDFCGIQATGQESIDFIRDLLPVAGVYVVSEEDRTGQVTNYGERGDITVRFRTTNGVGRTAAKFRVDEITADGVEEDVWCLEVEDDHSFILPFGLVTGNCTASYCDRIRFFQESFWLLLCGCGCGFSVQKQHIAKLPDLHPDLSFPKGKRVFEIPDTIEGWADALGVLLATHMPHPEFLDWQGYEVVFDFSKIRVKGSTLASGVGKAPGPDPLRDALQLIRGLFGRLIAAGQTRLRPIDAYDVVMHASDAVLSGGVRRSATLCMFSLDDMEMIKAKTGNWMADNPQRGRSNNSAVLVRNKVKWEDFYALIASVRQYGEPGFIWVEDEEALYNPCVSKDTLIATEDGLSSVEQLIGKQFTAQVDGNLYLSSHKGFWKTATKELVELRFSSGRHLKVTADHNIMTTAGWKAADAITSEDEVVVNDHRQRTGHVDLQGADYARGYCLGSFMADGNICHDSADMKWWGVGRAEYRVDGLTLLRQAGWASSRHDSSLGDGPVFSRLGSRELYNFAAEQGCIRDGVKSLSLKAATGSRSYLAGLLASYFDADGTVACNRDKGCSVRLTSTDEDALRKIQAILNYFGVFSKIYNDHYPEGERLLPDGKGGKRLYHCKATHELCISNDAIVRFAEVVKLRNSDKLQTVNEIVSGYKRSPNRTNFIDKLVAKSSLPAEDVYDATVEEVHAFDANGIYVHNCVEIGLYGYDEFGNSGWHFCNLCEINGKKLKTRQDFEIAVRAAAIIGTCQAGYTDFDYLGPVSKRIVDREALLGVSITGMMDHPEIAFDPELQREMAKLILNINAELAPRIGVNPTARATCVKPSGTASCVLGTASGVHPHHAKRYLRRAQGNKLEPVLQFFKGVNPRAVEQSVWKSTDEIVTFCVEVEDGAKTKNNMKAIELLDYVKLTQQNWIAAGKVKERCTKPWLMHNVSNTITVEDNEWDDVAKYIYDNRQFFAGISLLSHTGDLDFPQAPMCIVHNQTEIAKLYGPGVLFLDSMIDKSKQNFDNLHDACSALLGFGKPIVEPVSPNHYAEMSDEDHRIADEVYASLKEQYDGQMAWMALSREMAMNYFDGDLKQLTYAMKEIENWRQWCELSRTYKDVDYTLLHEESDTTTPLTEWACSGGACQVL